MKKFDRFKTVQLILTLLLAGIGLYLILTDTELYHLAANNIRVRMLCILLWLSFVLAFLFIFLDFSRLSSLKKDYRELDFAVSSDPVAGIANRYSCDAMIEKYLDKPLPPQVGCVMFDLKNIQEINQQYGHLKGNDLIRDFSGILQAASRDLCFVGRNGGNTFLALFENCSEEKLDTFLERMESKVAHHNDSDADTPIDYRYGVAFNEGPEIRMITDLIALSSRRIRAKKAVEDL
ncbi:MAG: GGDEF domain-containing protein [Lachnospiraceae bacterium]|jgi:diguanylate cyclase (GGDEF)-like protein|nr:GGDEF domain-containing protein [Lachnospiraceae bacterium]MCI8996693.1 GGDEF domain-containing protein [Lachnospiraceae bacterium]MCI9135781.1 GGDEF domain-containing protein [Lachnospiraceae bacterium]